MGNNEVSFKNINDLSRKHTDTGTHTHIITDIRMIQKIYLPPCDTWTVTKEHLFPVMFLKDLLVCSERLGNLEWSSVPEL